MSTDEDAERFREELNDAVDCVGCTEIWETLSEARADDGQADEDDHE